MVHKIKLKNANKHVLLSQKAYDFIAANSYYNEIKLLENLRLHSSGYVFFQRNYPQRDGKYKNLTIYVHKLVAEKFVEKPESSKRLFVRLKNSNPLDCRIKNLSWMTMSELRRNQKRHNNKTGYRGVVQVSKKTYRAVLYTGKKRHDLGLFSSAEEAASAYNAKSKALFGDTKSLNKVDSLLTETAAK